MMSEIYALQTFAEGYSAKIWKLEDDFKSLRSRAFALSYMARTAGPYAHRRVENLAAVLAEVDAIDAELQATGAGLVDNDFSGKLRHALQGALDGTKP